MTRAGQFPSTVKNYQSSGKPQSFFLGIQPAGIRGDLARVRGDLAGVRGEPKFITT
jgi:hypothetical protein